MAMVAREILGSHRSSLGWGAALAALCAMLLGAAPAQATTQTFLFTGAEQTFKVPGGVTSVHVVAIGGGGGSSSGIGGVAGQVTGDLTVTPGQTLYVEVGGRGQDGGNGGAGGFNGGGSGAAGGGGASDIRTSPRSAGLSPDHRLIVAAGGGGGGGAGEAGPGGTGGAVEEGGEEAETSGNEGGAAGSQTEGGVGGFGCGGNGSAGSLGEGGTGGSGAGASNSGGGGGGGYYGGGGCTFGGGGGGGGSSLLPFGGSQLLVGLAAEPEIQITYTLVPPSIELISPTEGATYVQGQAVNAVYFCTPPEGATVATCAGPAASGSPLDTATLGSHTFKVFAEDTDGATEAESVKYTVVAPPVKPTQTEPVVIPPPPPPLPETTIGTHPKGSIKTTKKKVKVKFSFSSTVAGASFECKLDKGPYEPCSSPKGYKVKLGKHKFSVQATSAAGTDPSAATFPFKVKKKQ